MLGVSIGKWSGGGSYVWKLKIIFEIKLRNNQKVNHRENLKCTLVHYWLNNHKCIHITECILNRWHHRDSHEIVLKYREPIISLKLLSRLAVLKAVLDYTPSQSFLDAVMYISIGDRVKRFLVFSSLSAKCNDKTLVFNF